MKIYAVKENADQTEGKGPMVLKDLYLSQNKAFDAAGFRTDGIEERGANSYRSKYWTNGWNEVVEMETADDRDTMEPRLVSYTCPVCNTSQYVDEDFFFTIHARPGTSRQCPGSGRGSRETRTY